MSTVYLIKSPTGPSRRLGLTVQEMREAALEILREEPEYPYMEIYESMHMDDGPIEIVKRPE